MSDAPKSGDRSRDVRESARHDLMIARTTDYAPGPFVTPTATTVAMATTRQICRSALA
jgi:hypothetical protein